MHSECVTRREFDRHCEESRGGRGKLEAKIDHIAETVTRIDERIGPLIEERKALLLARVTDRETRASRIGVGVTIAVLAAIITGAWAILRG